MKKLVASTLLINGVSWCPIPTPTLIGINVSLSTSYPMSVLYRKQSKCVDNAVILISDAKANGKS